MAAMQAMSMSMPGMDMGGMDMSNPAAKASGSAAAMPGMDMSQPGAMDHSQHMRAGSASGGNTAERPGMPGM